MTADGKTLDPYPLEQSVVARVRFHRAAGLTIRQIDFQVAHEGFIGRTGKPFIIGQVYKMLEAA